MGELLETYEIYRYEYTERSGLTLVLCNIFRVIIHWKRRRPHLLIGKSRSVVEDYEINIFCKS